MCTPRMTSATPLPAGAQARASRSAPQRTQTIERQHTYLSAAFNKVFADYPSMPQSARTYARDFIAHRFNQQLDPDTTKLVLFPMFPRYIGPVGETGYRRAVVNQRQEERTLTDVFIRNFDGNSAHLLKNARQHDFGIYTDDDLKNASGLIPAAGYELHPQTPPDDSLRASRISAPELYASMRAAGGNQFPQQYIAQLTQFWQAQRAPFAEAQTDLAHAHLDQAYFDEEITLLDWQDGHRAFAGTDLPHLDLRQLQLGTFTSHDSLLWTNRTSGRTLLYTPGEDKAFRAFDNLVAAQDWITAKSQDIDWLKRFTQMHLSANDAGNRESILGSPDIIGDALNLFSADGMPYGPRLTGNPFIALTDARATKDVEDASFIMNSNTDLNDSMLIHSMRLIPFLGAATALAIGKGGERTQGLISLGIDIATGPVSNGVGALAKAAAKGAAGAFKGSLKSTGASLATITPSTRQSSSQALASSRPLPFFRSPQRVNGQIGYPLSPNPVNLSAIALKDLTAAISRYDVTNSEIRQIGNPYYHWDVLSPASQQLFEQKTAQLYKDAQAFFQQHPIAQHPPRPRTVSGPTQAWLDNKAPYPYPPSNPEFTDQALHGALSNRKTLLGNGVIFGEDHTNSAARQALIDRIDSFETAGVKTLYLEALLRDDAPGELRNFNLTGQISDKLRQQLTKGHADDAMIALMTRAHAKGMKVVALDSLAAWNPPARAYDGAIRMTTMNYSAFNIINAEQTANGHSAWVALVGANHGKRTYDVPGLNEMTGAASVLVDHASSLYELPENQLDFTLAMPFPKVKSDRKSG